MIRFIGAEQTPFCDGHTRRSFLKAGFLGLGGLTLPQLLEARAQKGVAVKKTSVIYIELTGGRPSLRLTIPSLKHPPNIGVHSEPLRRIFQECTSAN